MTSPVATAWEIRIVQILVHHPYEYQLEINRGRLLYLHNDTSFTDILLDKKA